MRSIAKSRNPTGEAAMNSIENGMAAVAGVSGRELPVSVHRFRFWGALGRTSLFLFCGLMALVIGLGCLGGCVTTLASSPFEAVLWGLFSLCGFVTFPAAVYEGLRLFIQTPSVVFVYRDGLRWQKRGKETGLTWSEIARVERNVTVFVRAGRERRADATTIHFASGKKLRIWAEILTDYLTFADSVKDFHDNAQFERSAPGGPAPRRQRTKEIRCWHCGEVFDVPVTELSGEVRCRRCQAGLGVILS
jgi:hypothetical protein